MSKDEIQEVAGSDLNGSQTTEQDEPKPGSKWGKLVDVKSDSDELELDEVTAISAQQAELEQLRLAVDQKTQQVLRAQAELQNVQRRAEQSIANAHKFALEDFISKLLPVVDSLERGIETCAIAELNTAKEGMVLTLQIFIGALDKVGVIQLNPIGQKFDPTRHEAISAQRSNEHEPNTVLAVVQKGYVLNERVVRPAMVVVSTA